MINARFIAVDVEPGAASEDGVSLRFKVAGEERVARVVPYESEDGVDGRWRVFAVEGDERGDARAVLVEDSSDGVAWLVVGGAHGLLLEHVDTGAIAREPYLVLSKTARVE